eukprot:TRINITY_DN30611_c0_g1_i1.p1 TRINITY_DN30611_c0_g1~~TRINITY_DN30611_c0_g1_i1.p1  ORF type:complete len:227 (-),score=30.79 TRINITY_DN30611_c0_g1_i1:173-853(-)
MPSSPYPQFFGSSYLPVFPRVARVHRSGMWSTGGAEKMQVLIPAGCGNSLENDAYSVIERSAALEADASSGLGDFFGHDQQSSGLKLPQHAAGCTDAWPSKAETKMYRDFLQSGSVQGDNIGRALRPSHQDAALARNKKFTEKQQSDAKWSVTMPEHITYTDFLDTACDQKAGPLEPGLMVTTGGAAIESKSLEDDAIGSNGSARDGQRTQNKTKKKKNWQRSALA